VKITPAMYDTIRKDIINLMLEHAEIKKELEELKRTIYIK